MRRQEVLGLLLRSWANYAAVMVAATVAALVAIAALTAVGLLTGDSTVDLRQVVQPPH